MFVINSIIMNNKLSLVLLVCISLLAACNNNKPSNTGMPDPEGKVTAIQGDFVSLNQCPTEDTHFSVEVSPDFTSATISLDGEVIQTVTDEEGLVSIGDEATVHFLDANFDGFTDIFIGAGESRTYSTLLLWNAEKKQFHRIGELGNPDLQGFKLYPAEKKVIEGGSGSYCSFYITQSHWDHYELVLEEFLTIISDPDEYISYKVKNEFTIQDANEQVLCSTDNKESLPDFWQAVLKAYYLE